MSNEELLQLKGEYLSTPDDYYDDFPSLVDEILRLRLLISADKYDIKKFDI